MRLFSRNKEQAVQSFVSRIVNNNCPEQKALIDGPRLEGRVNLTLVVHIVPLVNKDPVTKRAFAAVTKEFSTTGVAVVLDQPMGLDEVFVGFRWEGEMTWVRAKAKHLNPMGAGFFQLGLRLKEVVHAGDYPELASLLL